MEHEPEPREPTPVDAGRRRTKDVEGSRGPLRVFFLAWMIAFSGAVTPGPFLALVIGQVLAQGFAAVIYILVGHALLEGLFVLAIARGLSGRLEQPRTRGLLAVLGGLAMLYMGLDIVLHAHLMSLHRTGAASLSPVLLILAGAGVSLSNPYFTGWWATVGTGQAATFRLRSPLDHLSFWIGHEMGDVVWYVFVALMLTLGRSWINDTVYHILLWTCGGVILLLALLFLGVGLRCLRPARRPQPS